MPRNVRPMVFLLQLTVGWPARWACVSILSYLYVSTHARVTQRRIETYFDSMICSYIVIAWTNFPCVWRMNARWTRSEAIHTNSLRHGMIRPELGPFIWKSNDRSVESTNVATLFVWAYFQMKATHFRMKGFDFQMKATDFHSIGVGVSGFWEPTVSLGKCISFCWSKFTRKSLDQKITRFGGHLGSIKAWEIAETLYFVTRDL